MATPCPDCRATCNPTVPPASARLSRSAWASIGGCGAVLSRKSATKRARASSVITAGGAAGRRLVLAPPAPPDDVLLSVVGGPSSEGRVARGPISVGSEARSCGGRCAAAALLAARSPASWIVSREPVLGASESRASRSADSPIIAHRRSGVASDPSPALRRSPAKAISLLPNLLPNRLLSTSRMLRKSSGGLGSPSLAEAQMSRRQHGQVL